MFKKYFVFPIVFLGFIIPLTAMAGDACTSAYYNYGEIIEEYDINSNNKIEYLEAKKAMEYYDELPSNLSLDGFMAVIRFMFYDCVIPSVENDPASGTLSTSATQVNVGETITLTVIGKDNDGLQNLWAHYQGSWHNKSVQGKAADATFSFSESKAGTYTYKGYVYGSQPTGIKETAWTEPPSVTVKVINVVLNKPDLTITSAELSNNDNKLYYTVKNQGNATAPTSESFFTIDGERGGVEYISSMTAGSSKIFHFKNWECTPAQSYRIGICADWDHKVSESNEDNNCYNITLKCPGAIQTDCQREYGQEYWCANYDDWKQECSGTGKANYLPNEKKCQLSGGGSANYCVTCQRNDDDSASGTLSVSSTTVEPGDNITLTITGQDDNGLYALLAYYKGEWHRKLVQGTSASADFSFSETQPGIYSYLGYIYGKTLNGNLEFDWTEPRAVTVTVRSAQVEGPDLIISSISTSPSSLTTADEVDFRVTIKNIGTQQMSAVSGGIITKVSSSSMDGSGYRICDAMTTRLKAGEIATIDCPIVQSLSAGSHSFTFLTDSSNRLSEGSETNNAFSKNITVIRGSIGQNDPVSGIFSTSATSVAERGFFTLKVIAQDDQGVDKIKIYYKDSWHTFDCVGQTSCTKSYELYESTAGTYTYYAKVYGYDLNNNSENTDTAPSQVVVSVTALNMATCTDSDGGANYFVKGSSSSSVSGVEGRVDCCKALYSTEMGNSVDHIGPGGGPCVTSGLYLYEAICQNGVPYTTVHACSNGCQDGVCR
ncbi:hypothetical protein KJ562_00690 [Patescibacteria group bacterium]|nr:hypothetical protein [Patescibacteria group bacterium]